MIYFKSQVDQLLRAKDEQIVFLCDQMDRLEKQLEVERGRAQNAIDQILYLKGAGPVTPSDTQINSKEEENAFLTAFASIGGDEVTDDKLEAQG